VQAVAPHRTAEDRMCMFAALDDDSSGEITVCRAFPFLSCRLCALCRGASVVVERV
jgi:hypothetical protein